MPTSNPTDILLQHDVWATRQILHACEKLTGDQFSRNFGMGPGSLQATTTHIIGAMRRWTDVLAQRPILPRLDQDGVAYSPAQLLMIFDESANEFESIAKSYPMNGVVTRVHDGKEYAFTRGAIVSQVITHGMHHRAQCLNMLKQLGVSPLPLSSVLEWTRSVDSQQATTPMTCVGDQTLSISITRVANAAPEDVFDGWIARSDLSKWWGPREGRRDWTTPHVETTPTTGGSYRICIRSPKGDDHWMGGIYRLIDRPRRLAFTFAWEKDHNENSKAGQERQVAVEFGETGGKTRVMFRIDGFPSVQARDGEVEGWTQTLNRFVDYFADRQTG
jgi:uncharacterized protein YndB with AHSA1/START domain/uncharacterized damage-inducible protein DinB